MSTESMKIVLTGGGTGGHVIPHLALYPEMKKRGWNVSYIGSNAIEKDIITKTDIEFYTIASGKLRRYFSFQNLLDVFKVAFGTLQSLIILAFVRPRIIFSKGGYVSVPVCLAAKCLGIPVVSHESDFTPGLATKIISRLAKKIFVTFEDTKKFFPNSLAESIGLPVRAELIQGEKQAGLEMCGFSSGKKVVLIIGGSQGSLLINETIVDSLDELLESYQIIHITGAQKGSPQIREGYKAFEYVSEGLGDLFAAADMVVSRAGANTIFELLSLRKPMLLIPLKMGSRGDQVDNADFFEKQGWAKVLQEDSLSRQSLRESLKNLEQSILEIQSAQSQYKSQDVIKTILDRLETTTRARK